MTNKEKHQKLQELAREAIVRLSELPQPVVRVSGPLTSGGYGYEENQRRFIVAQAKLREEGNTVFDYFEGNHDERHIVELALSWEDVMEHYHKPIMATGLIKTVFMMPMWETSNGAKWEHAFAESLGLNICELPSEWFE